MALTLVFAFMPFFANKLSSRDTEARLYSVVGQIETVHNVARIFLRDEFRNNFPNGTVVFSRNPSGCPDNKNCHFNAALEPYGLPMGFNSETIFKQDISLVAIKNENGSISGYIKLTRGDLSDSNLEWAQLLRMLGFYASGNESNINESTEIHITVPVEEPYTDVVLRRETDENIGFLTELDMGENNIKNIGSLNANKGDATDVAKIYNLSLVGDANIDTPVLQANISIFYPLSLSHAMDVSVLSLTNSNVSAGNALFSGAQSGTTATMYGIGTVIADNIYANVLHMVADDNNRFTVDGGATGAINGNIFLRKGSVKIYKNDLNVQNLFGFYYETDTDEPDPGEAVKSFGTDVRDTLYVNRWVATETHKMRAVIADVVAQKMPQLEVDINFLGGVSLIPDVLVVGRESIIDNSQIPFVSNFLGDEAELATCSLPFTEKTWVQGGELIKNSLVYNVLCQYLFYHRLERRINHKLLKKCIIDGACQ